MTGSAPAWRPDKFERRRPYLMARNRILKAMRQWFDDQGFSEVETPALQISPGMEPNLNPFETTLVEPDGRSQVMGLHTSPEFAMKKLLAAGAGPIFQIARVYRNGERSATHHPEFTMLEWYRPGSDWKQGAIDTLSLLKIAARAAFPLLQCGKFDPQASADWLSVSDAFQEKLGFDPLPLQNDEAALRSVANTAGIKTDENDGWDDIFFRCLLNRIEPHLGTNKPLVLHHYPARMAALAQIDPLIPLAAERFEVFADGIELANGFGELTDHEEYKRRFNADLNAITANGESRKIDEDFLNAVAHGLPSGSGVAMGFDRAVMLATGARHIEDVLWLPVANSV